MNDGYEKYFRRGDRYAVLNVTPREFRMPDHAGRKLVSDWVHHPRVRDFTKRLCVGSATVSPSLLYRVAFNVVITFDKPAAEMVCVGTLEEGVDYCIRRIREEHLPTNRPLELIRHELLARLDHVVSPPEAEGQR